MMDRIWRSRREEDHGFSLVELLIVIIIMGILAAIAIPIFLSQRAKAEDGATKADVETLGKELATWFVDNTAAPVIKISGNTYTMGATADSADQKKVSNKSPNVGVVSGSDGTVAITKAPGGGTTIERDNWCVALKNSKGSGDGIWSYSSSEGLKNAGCS